MAATSTVILSAPTTTTTRPTRRLWITGAKVGTLAAVANMALVAVADAAGVDLAVGGEAIPLVGFAQLTLVGAILGVLLAGSMAKWASRPRTTFVTVTAVLTALSIVPDVLVDATTATKVVLAATHLLAAAVIVPALAARLPE